MSSRLLLLTFYEMRNEFLDSGQIIINLIVILITFCFAAFFVACEFALVQAAQVPLKRPWKMGLVLGHGLSGH